VTLGDTAAATKSYIDEAIRQRDDVDMRTFMLVVALGASGCAVLDGGGTECVGNPDTPDYDVYTQAEVEDLRDVTCVEGHLFIHQGDVSDLSPLASMQEIHGVLSLHWNQQLDDAGGMDSLHSVDQGVSIQSNDRLQHIDAFDQLGTLGTDPVQSRITITGNRDLVSVVGFNGLPLIPGNLHILRNPALETIAGFAEVTQISDLSISENPLLTTLDGFANLQHVDSLGIVNNPRLPTCMAEQLRDRLGVTDATIIGNDDSAVCD
jgi:hypothetical protein